MARHLAIGDIHGCIHALRTLVDFVGVRPDDTVITLGDYVNRGPDSCAVLDWLIRFAETHTLVPIRGNHDIMMSQARDHPDAFRKWIECGGDATLRSYSLFTGDPGDLARVPDHHWAFLDERLAPAFEIDGHFFVHANAYPDLPIDEQPDFMLYWERFNDPPRHESGKIMVCGHTSQKSGMPAANGHAVCIDTWACGGGWLTCLHAESGTMWQANENGDTRRLYLDELEAGDEI